MSIWNDPIWLATQGGGGGGGGGVTPEQLEEALLVKADKVVGANAGNFAALDVNGNLTDSGYRAADFGSSKRLELLWKLAHGTVWDTETDTQEAYTKTVPSGAAAAEIRSFGGKTIVWNQKVYNANFAETSGWTSVRGSITYGENTLTITCNADGNVSVYGSADYASAFPAHKYLIFGDVEVSRGGYYRAAIGTTITSDYMSVSLAADTLTRIEGFITLAEEKTTTVRFGSTGELSVGDTITLHGLYCVDVTKMFGAGNEPTTTSDPRIAAIEAYAAGHPGFNAGSLLSAAVTSVESTRKTVVWNQMASDYSGITTNSLPFVAGTKLTSGHKYYMYASPPMPLSVYVGTENGAVQQFGTTSRVQETISDAINDAISNGKNANINGNVWLYRHGFTEIEKIVLTDLTQMFGAGNEPTDTSDPRIAAIEVYAEEHPERNAGQTIGQTTVDGQITFVTDSVIDELEIPVSLRTFLADKGYGWSAGSVYNELNLETKKYIQRVGSVDLGTLTYNGEVFGGHSRFNAALNGIKADTSANLLSAMYTKSTAPIGGAFRDLTITSYGTGKIYILNDSYTSSVSFKSAMSGVMLYYELATPIEYDISSYLTDDNTLTVEPGGTLTFVQDGTELAVPSSVDYLIKLSEVTV